MKYFSLFLVLLALTNCSAADKKKAEGSIAVFAGGCFWCMEPPFEKLKGVKTVVSGYTAGEEKNPTYKDVAYGRTGHTEAVQITYDPSVISYKELLHVFWRNIDPTAKNRQFVDVGTQYRAGIYYNSEAQKKEAFQSRRDLEESGRFQKPIVTEIEPLNVFYPAEAYHQDFYKKNPNHYYRYRRGSGRDAFLDRVWGKER
jgi:methionine-S-sulfoxide reductase